MKKEYIINITPTAAGDKWSIDVMHDGKYIGELGRSFNHQYTGKGTARKIVKLSRVRAEEYIAELEANGYIEYNREAETVKRAKAAMSGMEDAE